MPELLWIVVSWQRLFSGFGIVSWILAVKKLSLLAWRVCPSPL